MKGLAESFHLNGHIIGFRPQTQKLESPYKTLSNTLAVKGLINELTLDPKKPHFILVGRHARLSKVDATVHAISADSKHLDEHYAG